MLARVNALMGTTIAIVLVTAGLWGWGASRTLALAGGFENPVLGMWAIRSAAIAALAGAQALGLAYLVDAIRFASGRESTESRDRSGEVMRLLAGLICTACLVGSLGLAIASK